MIKAVLFDYDGVMTLDKSGTYTLCKYVSAKAGVDYEAFSEAYRVYNDDLLSGKKTHEEIWAPLCAALGKPVSIKHLFDSFHTTPLNSKMFDLVKNLKKKYKTALVTDNSKGRMETASVDLKLETLFDAVVVSADVGSGKEAEPIFRKALAELRVEAAECVFIDNQEKNLTVPAKMGMKTVFFDHKENDVKKLCAALKALQVEI